MAKVKSILKGIGKGIGKGVVDVAPDKQTAVYQKLWNKKLNPKIGYGVAGAGTVIGLASTLDKNHNRHGLGAMTPQDGPLSNMVGGATLSPLIEDLQNGEYDASRVDNSFSSRGADGDIVFALHNMR